MASCPASMKMLTPVSWSRSWLEAEDVEVCRDRLAEVVSVPDGSISDSVSSLWTAITLENINIAI